MSETALVILARYPEPGKVKTRLAETIGQEETLTLYQAFLHDLAERFSTWSYDLHWAYTPVESDFASFVQSLLPDSTTPPRVFPQPDADFATRLYQVFVTTQAKGYQRTILIGSDSPHLSRTLVQQAHDGLERADVVLGPAEDGGYYLIAMREPHDLFHGIPMSTNVVLQMTLAKAKQQGLSVHLLDPLFDVDEQVELWRMADLLQEDTTRAPHTAAALATLKKETVR